VNAVLNYHLCLQDDYYNFQSISFSSSAEKKRAIAGKKLAILEKAILSNPREEILHKLWLQVARNSCSLDEVLIFSV